MQAKAKEGERGRQKEEAARDGKNITRTLISFHVIIKLIKLFHKINVNKKESSLQKILTKSTNVTHSTCKLTVNNPSALITPLTQLSLYM